MRPAQDVLARLDAGETLTPDDEARLEAARAAVDALKSEEAAKAVVGLGRSLLGALFDSEASRARRREEERRERVRPRRPGPLARALSPRNLSSPCPQPPLLPAPR